VRRILAIAALALLSAGCGSSSPPPATTRVAVSPPPETLTVFRVENGELAAETVSVPQTMAPASAALGALGLAATVTIANGTAKVELAHATDDEVAEIVYTLTQLPSVQRVDVAGRTGLTRDDVASYVPPILVESPAAGATVTRTFRVSGSASVFEATLVVELIVQGQVASKQSVTASEGAPGRGTFTASVTSPSPGPARLVAYAPSAENGAPQHQVDVPLTITP
jgi:hypothetical protein